MEWPSLMPCFLAIILVICASLAQARESVSRPALSAAERVWLAAHPVIRVAPDPDFPPIEWFDKSGEFRGIAADVVRRVEEHLRIRFSIVRCPSWDSVLARARAREVDMLSAAAQTPQRSEYLLFTGPHITLPGVIITRKDAGGTMSLSRLAGMRVCVVSGYLWQEFIARDHPRIILDPVPDIQTGLRKVSFGLADAMVENVATAVQVIEQEGIPNLQVSGESGYSTKLSFAIRKDWPELRSILDKTLSAIGPAERKAVVDRYIHLSRLTMVPRRVRVVVGAVAGAVLLLICVIITWNHLLQRRVRVRTAQLEHELAERRRAEAALRASETKFIEMVENANSIILRMDTGGNVTFFNRFAEEFFGFTKAEIIGRNVVGTIVPPVDSAGQDLAATMRDLGAHPDRYAANQNENMRKDGSRVWVSWSNKPIRNADGRMTELLCVGNDITALKQTQEALRTERDFNSAIFDTAGALVVVLDPAGRIVRFNQTCEKLTGYAFAEVKGRPFWELFLLPGEMETVRARFDRLIAGDFPNQGENHWKLRDGGRRLISWYNTAIVDAAGKIGHIVSTGIDITEHRRADEELERHHTRLEELVRDRTARLSSTVEQLKRESEEHRKDEDALRESERRYRFLFEQSPAGNIIIGIDGKIKDINEYFLNNLGYAKDEVIGKPAVEFIVPEERGRVADTLKQRMAGVSVPERDNGVPAKDGSVHYIVFSSGQTQLYEGDIFRAILITGIDVTDRRKADALARRQQEQLVQADKMASLGILVSGVAHEINNPNNFIILNSDNLRDVWKDLQPRLDRQRDEHGDFQVAGLPYGEVREEMARLIDGIGDGAKRIRAIVQGLKDFARQEPGDLEQLVDVNEVLRAATLILSNLIRKSTDRFVYDLRPDIPKVKGNFQKIEQVMINLITNACQALTARAQTITAVTRASGGCVSTVIRDEGVGILAENMKHIMDPFFTTKRDCGGTGLGLSISYSIVKEHGGDLRIESTPGKGTVVEAVFPVAAPRL